MRIAASAFWTNRARLAAIILCVCVAQCAAAQNSTPNVAGYVFGIEGSWRVGPGFTTDLIMGLGLPNGAIVRLNTFSAKSFIRIGLIDKTVVELNCSTAPQRCREQTTLQVPKIDDTLTGRFAQIWNKLSAPPPNALILASTRGVSATPPPPPEEYVVSLSDSAALARIPDLGSEASLRPARGGDRIDLTLAGPRVRASAALQPGLYLLRRADAPDRLPAAILFVDAARLDRAQSDLSDARTLSASWPPDAAHAFRVSLLEELSREFASGR